jgi:hypothetical protein
MDLVKGYGILIFYGFLLLIFATIGNYLDKKNGFSNGFIVGSIVNLVLWFSVGKNMAKA